MKIQKKKLRGGWAGAGWGSGVGGGARKVWGRWVMWGMGDVNQE